MNFDIGGENTMSVLTPRRNRYSDNDFILVAEEILFPLFIILFSDF
jgi:hypothetical protein